MDGNPYISHPDHLATGEATLAAIYPAARDRLNFPELLDEGLEPWKVRQVLVTGAEQANLWVEVQAQLDTALAALRCHASQFDDWDAVEERVRERAREAGEAVGLPAAQAFLSILLD